MTTERPDARSTSARLDAVPTPRAGVPTVGFGVSAISASPQPTTTQVEAPVRRSRSVTVAAALIAVVAVVGGVVAFRVLVPTTPSADAAVARTAVQDDPDEVREQPGTVVRFGDEHTYGDGLEVAVNPPQRYQPSANATGAETGIPVRVQVVITNRTDSAFRPNTLLATASSAGQEAVAIWDPDQGIALTGPDVSIAAGATLHFYLAFAVAEPGDMTVELTPALYGYGATVVKNG